MKKLSKKGKVVLAVSMAVFALTCTVGVGMSKSKAATETWYGEDYINTTYGKLSGGVSTTGSTIKQCYSYAQTFKKPVPKIRAKGSVIYNSTGVQILSANTNWIYNSNFAQTKVMSTEGKYNSVGKKNNDFSGTTLRVYGTADAIVTNAYVVYTRDVW